MRNLAFGLVLALSAPVDAGQSVVVRETENNSFIATLLAGRELSIEEAQAQLLAASADACKGLIPTFGKYTFSSSKPASANSLTETTFEFNQAFTCEERAPVLAQVPPTVLSTEEKQRLVELVARQTETAISLPNEDAWRAFHSQFSPSLSSMLPLDDWLEQQTRIHQNAGAIGGPPLLKVTTYTDPPNSPGPGTYVAIDFQANYEDAPFRCGYVMWLKDPAGKLTVLRLEDGIINSKEAGSMTADELAQTKQQFRCFAP